MFYGVETLPAGTEFHDSAPVSRRDDHFSLRRTDGRDRDRRSFPGKGDLEVCGRAHVRDHHAGLSGEFDTELDRDFVGCVGEARQGDQDRFGRRSDSADRLLEGIMCLFDNPATLIPPSPGDDSATFGRLVRVGVVLTGYSGHDAIPVGESERHQMTHSL